MNIERSKRAPRSDVLRASRGVLRRPHVRVDQRVAPRSIAGFAACPRFLGSAVYRGEAMPLLQPTRILRHASERAEVARLGAWVERVVVRCAAELVVVVTDEHESEHERRLVAMLREIACRQRMPFLEATRAEVAWTLGINDTTNAALCSMLLERHPEVARDLRNRGVRSFQGPRSEAARYWTTPLLALGAALHAHEFIHSPMSNVT